MEYQFSKIFYGARPVPGPVGGQLSGDGKAEMEWDYWFQQARSCFTTVWDQP